MNFSTWNLRIIASQFLFLSFFSSEALSQGGTLQNRGFMHEGNQRSYLLYVPAAYTGDEAWPLVLNYHGFSSNATNQMELHSRMNPIADTAHFFVAYPQGLSVENLSPAGAGFPKISTGWNIPGFFRALQSQDDIAFTDSLINDVQKDFIVDPARIHLTGMSNGSMMAFWAGYKLQNRIASVAGVAGPISYSIADSIDITRPFSTLFMHGTSDPVVPYGGLEGWFPPAETTPSFWARHNNCSMDSIVTELPDVDPNDGSTVTLIKYTGCDQNTEVLFYRINNGGHTWPGGTEPFPLIGNGNFDINGSSEIWNFFKRNPHPEITTGIAANNKNSPSTFWMHQNYPNPFNPTTTIEFSLPQSGFVTLQVYNLLGQEVATVLETHKPAGRHAVNFDASTLASGLYNYTLTVGDFKQTRKMLLLR